MQHLDITIDFETCAISSNAAVLQLGAVAWNRHATENPFILNGETEAFCQSFDLRDQFFAGRDFNAETAKFWADKQKDNVKEGIVNMEPIATRYVLYNFVEWVKDTMNSVGASSVCLWSQGTDFDIAILRSLAAQFNVDLPKNIHKNFRDCRTYIQEVGARLFTEHQFEHIANPDAVYEAIEKKFGKPDLQKLLNSSCNEMRHDALYDSIMSTWNVYHCIKCYWASMSHTN